jgi:hypothetical protein
MCIKTKKYSSQPQSLRGFRGLVYLWPVKLAGNIWAHDFAVVNRNSNEE